VSRAFLRPDLAVRSVDFPARLRAGCALTGGIALENYGAMKEVAAEGKVEVFAVVVFETERFHLREFVDGGEDC